MKTRSITGFALMEVLVVLGITFIALGGIMSLTNYTNSVSLNAIQQNEAIMLHNEIYSLLKDSLACQGSFTPFTANDVGGAFSNPTQLLRSDGTVAFQSGGTYGSGKLQIQGFSLGDFTPDDAVTSPNTGKATLRINITKVGNPLGPKDIVRDVRMGVTRSPGTNLVTSCVSMGGTKDIWNQNPDGSIYYNGGNVGIGEDTPPFKFVVRDKTNVYPSTPIAEIAGNGEPVLNLTSASNNPMYDPIIKFNRARGTITAPTNIVPGDDILNLVGFGYYNGQFRIGGSLTMEVDSNSAAVPPYTTFIPMRLVYIAHNPVTGSEERRFVIANDGNVGIGTPNPTDKLHILDDNDSGLRIDGNGEPMIHIRSSSDTPWLNPLIFTARSRGTRTARTAVADSDSLFQLNVLGYGGATNIPAAEIIVQVDGVPGPASMPGRIEFHTQPAGGNDPRLEDNVPRMVIKNDGKIGMGVADPIHPLHVATEAPGDQAILLEHANNDPAQNPNFSARRSRGTLAAKTAVQTGDEISEFGSLGYDGTQYLYSADMRAVVDGPVAANSIPTRLEFRTQGVIHNFAAPPTRMTIDSQGFVGIGTTNPSYKLDVRGGDINIEAANSLRFGGTSVCTSVGCTAVSDGRLKENIQPLENSLEKILQLQGVEYDYRDKAKFGDKHHIGVIAQETEKIFPEVVVTDKKSGFKAVAYDHLVAPLIEAVKSLYYRIVGIDAKIQALEIENAQLKARADKAEKENAEIMARLEKIEKALIAK